MPEQDRTRLQGVILRSQGGFYLVRTPQGDFICRGRGLFRKTDTVLLVGDRVTIEPTQPGEGCIVGLSPRKNSLIRPAVANIDRLAMVVSTAEPVPNLLVIDRLTAIAARREIPVVFVITKTDLADPQELIATYRAAGYPVYPVNNLTGEGVGEVGAMLRVGITAFCGNSGAGKSSLLNALFPGLTLSTGEISKKLGRGRHTTRHVELYEAGEGYIADTPGFSAIEFLRFERLLASELDGCFPEFSPYLDKCRFTGCGHIRAKDCAVIAAVEAGEIPESRYRSYCAIYEELKNIKEWELTEKTPSGS